MKLLSYTSYRYMLFTSMLTLISVPIFYVALSSVFVRSIDKYLAQEADGIPVAIQGIQSERDLELWRSLDNDLTIVSADSIRFSAAPFNVGHYRVLQKRVVIRGRPYVVSIKTSLYEKEELISTILYIQLGILFLLLGGAVIIKYLINKRVWRPFYDCLQFIQEFEVERYELKEPSPVYIREFEQLNQSVHALLKKLHRSYYSQKEFLENVSHELKTPVAILKFKLELLLQEQELTDEQGILIADMNREIGQMQELNNNLLLLSKIDNGQFDTHERFDIIHEIKDVVEELSFLASSKMQRIVEYYACEEVELACNRMLMKVLVRNLLVNAVRYTDKGAEIQFFVFKDRLLVMNPGKPLKVPVNALFERFNSARNGLGLAIVKNIADYSGYAVTYEYIDEQHVFYVRWGGF